MNTVSLNVDDLTDDGASYLMEQLYGLAPNCTSSWQAIGAIMERSKVGVGYFAKSKDWNAEVEVEEETEYSSASSPRLAVAKVLIKKALLENPSNSFTLKLPLKSAFSFGLSRDSVEFTLLLAMSGGVMDEEEKVLVELAV